MKLDVDDMLALQALNSEFAHRVDIGSQESTAELFTEDGWYAWRGRRSVGRQAIAASYRARASQGQRTARHLWTNLMLTPVPPGEVKGRLIMEIFAEYGAPPLPAVLLLVADVEDYYVKEDKKWLFKSRLLVNIFTDASRSPVLPLVEKM